MVVFDPAVQLISPLDIAILSIQITVVFDPAVQLISPPAITSWSIRSTVVSDLALNTDFPGLWLVLLVIFCPTFFSLKVTTNIFQNFKLIFFTPNLFRFFSHPIYFVSSMGDSQYSQGSLEVEDEEVHGEEIIEVGGTFDVAKMGAHEILAENVNFNLSFPQLDDAVASNSSDIDDLLESVGDVGGGALGEVKNVLNSWGLKPSTVSTLIGEPAKLFYRSEKFTIANYLPT